MSETNKQQPPPLTAVPNSIPDHILKSSLDYFKEQLDKVYEIVPNGHKLDVFEGRLEKAFKGVLSSTGGANCTIIDIDPDYRNGPRVVEGSVYNSISKCSVVLGLGAGTLSVMLTRERGKNENANTVTARGVTVQIG